MTDRPRLILVDGRDAELVARQMAEHEQARRAARVAKLTVDRRVVPTEHALPPREAWFAAREERLSMIRANTTIDLRAAAWRAMVSRKPSRWRRLQQAVLRMMRKEVTPMADDVQEQDATKPVDQADGATTDEKPSEQPEAETKSESD